MRYRNSIGTIALAALFATAAAGARAHDETRYPDWSGQWLRTGGIQWDPSKPIGRGQQAPLTPEYQAVFEASLADQARGGAGNDARYSCLPVGMPRLMSVIFPMEFIFSPKLTYILFENNMPRRIYTDGRDWPKDPEPTFAGYSIGTWRDEDGDGHYDTLTVETRGFKGPRTFDASGLPLHEDGATVVKERIYPDKSDRKLLHDEITVIDNALTRPWTVTRSYRRDPNARPVWREVVCAESNRYVGDRQRHLPAERGRLLDAGAKGPGAAGLELFPQGAEIAAGSSFAIRRIRCLQSSPASPSPRWPAPWPRPRARNSSSARI